MVTKEAVTKTVEGLIIPSRQGEAEVVTITMIVTTSTATAKGLVEATTATLGRAAEGEVEEILLKVIVPGRIPTSQQIRSKW